MPASAAAGLRWAAEDTGTVLDDGGSGPLIEEALWQGEVAENACS